MKWRLWLNDGSCVRLRPKRRDHVWAYNFVEDRTHDGRKFRMLCVVDEFSCEALAIKVDRRLNSSNVIDTLAETLEPVKTAAASCCAAKFLRLCYFYTKCS